MESIEIKITAAVENAEAAKSVGDLRKSLKELNSLALQTQGVNDKAFKQISKAIGETSDRMEDLRDEFVAFKGSALEKFNNTLNLTKEGFQNLDFDKVGTSLKNLGNVIKANPLLILSSVIIELVQSFDKLKSMGGLIGDVFTEIGNYVDQSIQSLKDFTDQIGLTAFATEEAGNKMIESYKKVTNAAQNRYDAEIEYAKAAGRETFDLEIKKQQAILETNKNIITVLQARKIATGSLNDEDQKQLDELIQLTKDAYKTINVLNIQKNTKQVEDAKKTGHDIVKEEKRKYEEIDRLQTMFEIESANREKNKVEQTLKETADLSFDGVTEIERRKQLAKDSAFNVATQQDRERAKELINREITDEEEKQAALDLLDANVTAMRFEKAEAVYGELSNMANAFFEQREAEQLSNIEKEKGQLDERYSYEEEKINHKANAERLTESQTQQLRTQLALQKQKEQDALDKREADIRKKAFNRNKIFQIGQIAISLASEIAAIAASAAANPANAITFGGAGITQAALLTGIAVGRSAIQAGAIAAQKPPAFATGGLVKGPGTGTSDSIDAKLSNGESVMNANSTSMFAPLLSLINQAGGGKSFTGTSATTTSGNESNSVVSQTPVVKAYVTEVDMTRSQDKAKRVDRLSSF